MEIKNSNHPGVRSDQAGSKPATAASGSAAGGAAGSPVNATTSGDRVTLTGAAQQLLNVARSGDGGAPVDSARVTALREAIAEGRYAPDAERIADRLFSLDDKL